MARNAELHSNDGNTLYAPVLQADNGYVTWCYCGEIDNSSGYKPVNIGMTVGDGNRTSHIFSVHDDAGDGTASATGRITLYNSRTNTLLWTIMGASRNSYSLMSVPDSSPAATQGGTWSCSKASLGGQKKYICGKRSSKAFSKRGGR